MIGSNFPQLSITPNTNDIQRVQTKPSIAFGKKEYEDYLNINLFSEPPLPANIDDILNSPCPFSKEKRKVKDTHCLVLIPANINNQELTIKTFGKIIHTKICEFDNKSGYNSCHPLCQELGTDGSSRWVLLTKEILDSSHQKTLLEQQQMIAELGKSCYRLPRALEVVVCLITEYVVGSKTRFYSKESEIFTHCAECDQDYRAIVGCFDKNGLNISINRRSDLNCKNVGAAALMEL